MRPLPERQARAAQIDIGRASFLEAGITGDIGCAFRSVSRAVHHTRQILSFLRRLAALVPPPKGQLGALLRSLCPQREMETPRRAWHTPASPAPHTLPPQCRVLHGPRPPSSSRVPWAKLLKRTFRVDPNAKAWGETTDDH